MKGEKFSTVKERIQKKLEITEKDFEKVSLTFVEIVYRND